MSHFFLKKVLDFQFRCLYSDVLLCEGEEMRETDQKISYYWRVEAVDKTGKILYNGIFHDFEKAWNKYYSFKGKASVLLQRKRTEVKIA